MNRKVGALWTKSYEKDGQTVPYYQGSLDLGVFGELQVALFHKEKQADSHSDFEMVSGRGADRRHVGAFWKSSFQDDDGQEVVYLSGKVEAGVLGNRHVAVFLNRQKNHDSQPDFNIVMRKDDGNREQD